MSGRDSFRFDDMEGDALLLVEGIEDARELIRALEDLDVDT